jgi:hypothetical protein
MKRERLRVLDGGVALGLDRQIQHPANPIAALPPIQSALDPLVGPDDIARAWQCSRRLIEQMRATGRFPKPDVMLGRLPRWKVTTIKAWLAQQGGEGQP